MNKLFVLIFIFFFCGSTIAKERVSIEIKTDIPSGTKPKRAPLYVSDIYIEEHVLSFGNELIGKEVQVYEGDLVVFSGIIDANGKLFLPEALYGIYDFVIDINIYQIIGHINILDSISPEIVDTNDNK